MARCVLVKGRALTEDRSHALVAGQRAACHVNTGVQDRVLAHHLQALVEYRLIDGLRRRAGRYRAVQDTARPVPGSAPATAARKPDSLMSPGMMAPNEGGGPVGITARVTLPAP